MHSTATRTAATPLIVLVKGMTTRHIQVAIILIDTARITTTLSRPSPARASPAPTTPSRSPTGPGSALPSTRRNSTGSSTPSAPGTRTPTARLCLFTQDRKEAIRVEVTRLLAAGFIREVTHPEWLANPILVKKKNGEWRMCVDYTDLNKHCPKDPFPLPRIDQVVDSTAGCALLSFLDCYSGYH